MQSTGTRHSNSGPCREFETEYETVISFHFGGLVTPRFSKTEATPSQTRDCLAMIGAGRGGERDSHTAWLDHYRHLCSHHSCRPMHQSCEESLPLHAQEPTPTPPHPPIPILPLHPPTSSLPPLYPAWKPSQKQRSEPP